MYKYSQIHENEKQNKNLNRQTVKQITVETEFEKKREYFTHQLH